MHLLAWEYSRSHGAARIKGYTLFRSRWRYGYFITISANDTEEVPLALCVVCLLYTSITAVNSNRINYVFAYRFELKRTQGLLILLKIG